VVLWALSRDSAMRLWAKASMGIESHFNLWDYFFRALLRPSSNTEVVVMLSLSGLGRESIHTSAF
jgi:hypothetical protein